MRYGDVIGYVYQADLWCMDCIPEDLVAKTVGRDERSYDSDDLPKAVLYGQDDCDDEVCCSCFEPLVW